MSNKIKYYRQCKLRRPISNGISTEQAKCVVSPLDGSKPYEEMVSWIPEKKAEVGRHLRLKAEDGKWFEGWEVISVGGKKEASKVEDKNRDYLKQRKASDV